MKGKKHKPEQIIRKLREAIALLFSAPAGRNRVVVKNDSRSREFSRTGLRFLKLTRQY